MHRGQWGWCAFTRRKWHIDPHKIGVLGFSSGGHVSAAISTHFAKRLYPAVDAAEKESCRPGFAVPIYPRHLSLSAAEWNAKQGTKKFVAHHPTTADKDVALKAREARTIHLALAPDSSLIHPLRLTSYRCGVFTARLALNHVSVLLHTGRPIRSRAAH
jgi:acetyl esterase/lipase